jgi:hypothetical protein
MFSLFDGRRGVIGTIPDRFRTVANRAGADSCTICICCLIFINVAICISLSGPSTVTHGSMARGGHGISKVSPGAAMFYPAMPCGKASPETNHFRGGPPRGLAACNRLLTLWTPHAVHLSTVTQRQCIDDGSCQIFIEGH